MKNLNKLLVLKIITGFILSVIVPYILTFFYKLDRPYLLIFIFTFLSYFLFLLNFLLKNFRVLKLIIQGLIIVLYFVAAVYIFLRIIIIPYPFYQAWLIFIQKSLSGGIISYIFIFLISYFISLFGGLIFNFGFLRPISAAILTFSIMMSISFQNSEYSFYFFAVITVSVILCLFSLTLIPFRKKFLPFYSSFKILIIAFVISFILFLLTDSKSGWLSEYSLTPNFKNLIKSVIPDLPFLPEMDGYGNFFETKGLGGKLVMHRQHVFEINAEPDEVIYLRTKVYQKYTGSGWERDAEIKKEVQNKSGLNNDGLNLKYIKIKLLADYYSLIPHTLDTVSIDVHGYENGQFNYADFDAGFELKLPVIKGAEFILGTNGKNNNEIKDKSIYLNIPALLRKKIESSEFNFKDHFSDTDKLNKIKSRLTGNYRYSIYSKSLGLDEDFVDNFLFGEKRGYCEHFASSMAVIARSYNIPSRFVTGYLVFMPSDKDTAVCTGMMAHAWAEIYLKDKGWTVWEATPPVDYMIENKTGFDEMKNIYDKDTLEQIKEIFRYNIIADKRGRWINFEILIIFLLLFSAVIFTGIIVFFFLNFYKKNKSGFTEVYEPGLRKIRPFIKKLLKITGKRVELKSPDQTGWLKWADEYKKYNPQNSTEIDNITDIIIKCLYSENKDIDKKLIRLLKLNLKKIK